MSDGSAEDKSFRERVEEIRRQRKEAREQRQSSTPIYEISLQEWIKEVQQKQEPERQDSSSAPNQDTSFEAREQRQSSTPIYEIPLQEWVKEVQQKQEPERQDSSSAHNKDTPFQEQVEEIRRQQEGSQEWDSLDFSESIQLLTTDKKIEAEDLLNRIENIRERVDNENNPNFVLKSSSSISNQRASFGGPVEENGKQSKTEQYLHDLGNFSATEQSTSSISNTTPDLNNTDLSYEDFIEKDRIGQGGNADVTKATLSTEDGTASLAIKKPRLSGTISRSDMDKIIQEAEIWDKLDGHDHIVNIVGYGRTPVPWIAMEYMNGGHLGDRSGTMDIPQALWTAIAVTKGVRHAHQRGVVHLDLKPENVLFCSVEGVWDVPKVADWGLSKRLLDHSQSIEGFSPGYAAPEQFDEKYGSVDHLTDIYQLGAVFYNLFTGKSPFRGKPGKAMHRVLNEDPTPPTKIAEVPEKLDEILGKALAKEKHDRYEDIVYLRDDLQELSENLNLRMST